MSVHKAIGVVWCRIVNGCRDGDLFRGGWYVLGSKLKIVVICERGCVVIFC